MVKFLEEMVLAGPGNLWVTRSEFHCAQQQPEWHAKRDPVRRPGRLERQRAGPEADLHVGGRSIPRCTLVGHAGRAEEPVPNHLGSGSGSGERASIGGGAQGRVARGDRDVLGERARKMFTEHLELDTERLFAGLAVLAGEIADAAVDDHGVADFELIVGDATKVADGIDDTAGVGAEHPGWRYRDTGQAAEDEKVQMIERGGSDANADLAALGLGLD